MSKDKNALIFTLSMLMTLVIAAFAAAWLATDLPEEQYAAAPVSSSEAVRVLLCAYESKASYAITVKNGAVEGVKRLYFDSAAYLNGGLSAAKETAQTVCGEMYDEAIAVTDTQLAAIIDYVGGIDVNVDTALSKICTVEKGEQVLTGIAAIRIFTQEQSYRALCLQIIEETANRWCEKLWNSRAFFRLIDLSDCTLSYARYLPYARYFEKKG